MIRAMDHFSTIDFRNTSLIDGLEFLYQYVELRILSQGRLLVETDKLLRNHMKSLLPINQVGFIDPDTHSIYNISKQAEIFKSLFALERRKNLKESLRETIDNNQNLEIRFQKLFNRRPWPVDLEK